MSAENKEIVRRSFEDVWTNGKMEAADALYSADHKHHISKRHSISLGPSGLKRIVSLVRAAFPDSQFIIDDMVSEGDRVVVRWTGRGHFIGSNRQVVVTGIGINRIADGKIVESWAEHNAPHLARELGILDEESKDTS